MRGRTYNKGVESSLRIFTGEPEMRVVDVRGNQKAEELSRGRRCHNCGNGPLVRFVPIPSQKEIVCICEDCMFHILGLNRVDPVTGKPFAAPEREADPVDVFVATHSLLGILAETGG